MSNSYDGDRESARRARSEDAARREADRPAGAEARPRITPRYEERRTHPEPGLGTAPTGVPSMTGAPEEAPPAVPPESKPGAAAAFGILGAVILVIGLIALPFFIFTALVALPIALVVLIIAAALLAVSRRGPDAPPGR